LEILAGFNVGKLILLVEPPSAVDSETKRTILEELRRIHEQTGVTMIHVTHDLWEAASLAGILGVINTGKILQVGGKVFTSLITRQSFFEMQLNIDTPVHAICKTTSVHVL
jgi:ABC-type Fe3+/spermidine/putrescine transport system ATPase subunit